MTAGEDRGRATRPVRRRTIRVAAALTLALAATVALEEGVEADGASASRIRIVSGPALVRAFVAVPGANLRTAFVEASDPHPRDGTVRVVVHDRKARVPVPRLAARAGVTVRARRAQEGIVVTATAAAGRFKYLAVTRSAQTGQIKLELWKAVPATDAAVRRGSNGCLTIVTARSDRRAVVATGRERGVFEHQFALRLRNARGHLIAERPLTAADGGWRATVGYRVQKRQRGMLEAYDTGAGEGATYLCLAQVPVWLRP